MHRLPHACISNERGIAATNTDSDVRQQKGGRSLFVVVMLLVKLLWQTFNLRGEICRRIGHCQTIWMPLCFYLKNGSCALLSILFQFLCRLVGNQKRKKKKAKWGRRVFRLRWPRSLKKTRYNTENLSQLDKKTTSNAYRDVSDLEYNFTLAHSIFPGKIRWLCIASLFSSPQSGAKIKRDGHQLNSTARYWCCM